MLCFIPNYKFLVLLHGGGAGVAPCRWHQEFPEPTSLMWMEQTGLGGSVHPGSPREPQGAPGNQQMLSPDGWGGPGHALKK